MSRIGIFQLPPIKGTDLFPEAIQAPPVVKASVEYIVDPKQPYNPEVLSDYAKNVLADNIGTLGHFLRSQRQNYNAGITDVARTSRSYPEFDVSYANIQNRHEIITVKLRVDVRRFGEKVTEQDQMMLLVLHDGNRLTAIPMASISAPAGGYRKTCGRSDWGNDRYVVNQLRLGDTYSVVFSEVSLLNQRCTLTFGSIFILTDEYEPSLQAGIDELWDDGRSMNGSGGSIYTNSATYFYDGISVTQTGEANRGGAIGSGGESYEDTSDTGEGSSSSGNFYVCSLSTGDDRGARPATIRHGSWTVSSSPVTASAQNTIYIFEGGGGGGGWGSCRDGEPITVTPRTESLSDTRANVSVTWDGLDLGTVTATAEIVTNKGEPTYVYTWKVSGRSVGIRWYHFNPPLGDGASGFIPGVSGSYTFMTTGMIDLNFSMTSQDFACLYGAPVVGQPWTNIADTDETIDAEAQRQAELSAQAACACDLSGSLENTQGPYIDSIQRIEWKYSGKTGWGGALGYPYAVDDRMYYYIIQGSSRTTYTPYGNAYTTHGVLEGWLNVTNGQHLIQGYEIDGQTYIVLDGADYGGTLAGACGTDVSSINAVFMDVPLSKIIELD